MAHRPGATQMLRREPRSSANCRRWQRGRVVATWQTIGMACRCFRGRCALVQMVQGSNGRACRCRLPCSRPGPVTTSRLLSAAEATYSPANQLYRGSCLPTWNPNEMVPTPVRLLMFQHPTGKGWGHEPVGTNRKRLGVLGRLP